MSDAADWRRLALTLPGAVESAHMGHPDFRVGGRIFATLPSSEGGRGVVKLTRERQEMLCEVEAQVFSPVKGRWGLAGWTEVDFGPADEATLQSALAAAWRTVAPKRAVAAFDAGAV